uniref:Uncharacterized protein n=1 Tax=Meloidogyne javanica TaxID=6303 RepID=A0A915N7Y2_MELJA
MQLIIGQSITIEEFGKINEKLVEAISDLKDKSKKIINEGNIKGILGLIGRNIVEARLNLSSRYKEIKSKRMEALPLRFRQINDAISLIEAGIETAMKSPGTSNKGLRYALKEYNLTISVKQFEQNYLYMKFAQVLLKFHDILNKIVSAKILEDDNFPDTGEMLYAWILRSDVIVPYIERINGNSELKTFEDNQKQDDIQRLLSQTLHEKVNNMLGTFTHDVVLLKTMELPHVDQMPIGNGAIFYQMYIMKTTDD